MTPPIVVPSSFRIIAHRGASAYAPENTMAAFSLANRMGIREVELDVQMTCDHRLVICHDRVLDRYGHPGRVVAETTLAELQRLDMGAWFSPKHASERMLTLGQLFDRFGSEFAYHIEIKEPAFDIEQAVLDAVAAHSLADAVIVTSFHYDALRVVRHLAEETRIGWLVRRGALADHNLRRAAEIGCHQICPRASDLTLERVVAAHAMIPEVRAHHVKTAEDVLRVIETGCDGLTINHPDWLKHQAH